MLYGRSKSWIGEGDFHGSETRSNVELLTMFTSSCDVSNLRTIVIKWFRFLSRTNLWESPFPSSISSAHLHSTRDNHLFTYWLKRTWILRRIGRSSFQTPDCRRILNLAVDRQRLCCLSCHIFHLRHSQLRTWSDTFLRYSFYSLPSVHWFLSVNTQKLNEKIYSTILPSARLILYSM